MSYDRFLSTYRKLRREHRNNPDALASSTDLGWKSNSAFLMKSPLPSKPIWLSNRQGALLRAADERTPHPSLEFEGTSLRAPDEPFRKSDTDFIT